MANPSPAAIAAIKGQVATIAGGWGNPDGTLVAVLNAPAVRNPQPQGQVPSPIFESVLDGLLAPASAGAVLNWPNFGLIKADIAAGNRAGLLVWAGRLQALGLITAADAQAVAAYLSTPVPDPAYTPVVSWAQATLGRAVDGPDVAVARAS